MTRPTRSTKWCVYAPRYINRIILYMPEKKDHPVKKWLNAIIFVLITVLIVTVLDGFFGISNVNSDYAKTVIKSYYAQDKDTVDAVLIGNSHIFRFWESPFAWNEYGLAALPITTADMPAETYKYVAKEALKTQSPQVLVFDVNAFAGTEMTHNNFIYLLLNNMKKSSDYYAMIDTYCRYEGISGFDRLQYYLPLVQFHSRWSDLNEGDFDMLCEYYLNAYYEEGFLSTVLKTASRIETDERADTAPKYEEALNELLNWCDEQEIAIEFVGTNVLSEETQAMINRCGDIIEARGYPFVDYNDSEWFDDAGYDTATDFMDVEHTNIKGAYKFTLSYALYLKNKYDLKDRRTDESYSSWSEAAEGYLVEIEKYFVP